MMDHIEFDKRINDAMGDLRAARADRECGDDAAPFLRMARERIQRLEEIVKGDKITA
jgi:hypothetical protein